MMPVLFFFLQTLTNVNVYTAAVIRYVPTLQVHFIAVVRKDTFWVMINERALVSGYFNNLPWL